MEILIVDDEGSTRQALREVLTQLGHKTILEAKNGEEALKAVDEEKTKIRMIIADWEMPCMDGVTFSDRLAERENLDSIPFLLITSDLPASRLAEIQEHHKRIDHSLFKPFRVKVLDDAIKTAFANRVSRRDAALWLGSGPPPRALADSIAAKRQDVLFKQVVADPASKSFSAVLLDIGQAGPDIGAVASLRKTALGGSAIWVCLSRDPARIAPYRTICHQFVDPDSLATADGWSRQLAALHRRITNGWEIEQLSLEAKSLLQQKKAGVARKTLERLLTLDPVNAESHAWLADILIQEKDTARAIHHELEALKLNPCLPKPYIKLFEVMPKTDGARIAEVAAAARAFCPQSADVLGAAVDALKASGNPAEAEKLGEQLRALSDRKK